MLVVYRSLQVAVSNIASVDGASPSFLEALREMGVCGIEVAPSKEDSLQLPVRTAAVREFKRRTKQAQLEIVSMHSLTFGLTDVKIFGSREEQRNLHSHLLDLARMSHDLECPVMVFGSPSARQRGFLGHQEATELAIDFFQDLTANLETLGVCLALEALESHLADFLNSFDEVKEIYDSIRSPALALHVDLRAALFSGESVSAIFDSFDREIKHVHLSGPQMTLPDLDKPEVVAALASISQSAYRGYVSLEVPHENIPDRASLESVTAALSSIHAES